MVLSIKVLQAHPCVLRAGECNVEEREKLLRKEALGSMFGFKEKQNGRGNKPGKRGLKWAEKNGHKRASGFQPDGRQLWQKYHHDDEQRNGIVLISCQALQAHFPEDEAERQEIHFPHQLDEKPKVPAYRSEDHAERRRILGNWKRRNTIISTSGSVTREDCPGQDQRRGSRDGDNKEAEGENASSEERNLENGSRKGKRMKLHPLGKGTYRPGWCEKKSIRLWSTGKVQESGEFGKEKKRDNTFIGKSRCSTRGREDGGGRGGRRSRGRDDEPTK